VITQIDSKSVQIAQAKHKTVIQKIGNNIPNGKRIQRNKDQISD